jgi:hypothetical protein
MRTFNCRSTFLYAIKFETLKPPPTVQRENECKKIAYIARRRERLYGITKGERELPIVRQCKTKERMRDTRGEIGYWERGWGG